MNLTKEQQQQYVQRFNDELEKITMSWFKELREWHPVALKALDFANMRTVNVPPKMYAKLFETETHGINMNVVAVLANNLEGRTPAEMDMTAFKWRAIIELNNHVGDNWEALSEPVRKKLDKEFEIMSSKPSLVIAKA